MREFEWRNDRICLMILSTVATVLRTDPRGQRLEVSHLVQRMLQQPKGEGVEQGRHVVASRGIQDMVGRYRWVTAIDDCHCSFRFLVGVKGPLHGGELLCLGEGGCWTVSQTPSPGASLTRPYWALNGNQIPAKCWLPVMSQDVGVLSGCQRWRSRICEYEGLLYLRFGQHILI